MFSLTERVLDEVPKLQLGIAAIDKFVSTTSQEVDSFVLRELIQAASRAERVEVRMAGALWCVWVDPQTTAFSLLKDFYSLDLDWRVRETVAKAFDRLCKKQGYSESLAEIRYWLQEGNAGMRRAVAEGLRPWTNRSPFREEPRLAVSVLAGLKNDPDERVRLSAANALADISKKYPDVVRLELAHWDQATLHLASMVKRASRHLK